jgi:hypothetical protein
MKWDKDKKNPRNCFRGDNMIKSRRSFIYGYDLFLRLCNGYPVHYNLFSFKILLKGYSAVSN